jgi:hypothetical protein
MIDRGDRCPYRYALGSVLRLPSRYFGIKNIQYVALNQRKIEGVNSPSRRHLGGF